MIITSQIKIITEKQNHGNWLKIFIPYATIEKTTASLQNSYGEILKQVKLNEGNNAIDIINIEEDIIIVKIETAYETISKKINIPH